VWHPIAADGAASGDLGFTVGEAVLRGRGPKGEVRERGTKYLSIWQRQPDGVWRFVMDGGNSRPTATLTPRRGHPSR
jgi:ketosteroid isomerase-like protein